MCTDSAGVHGGMRIPWAVRFSLWVLILEGTVVAALLGIALFGILTEASNSFGGGIAIVGLIVTVPPTMLCWLSVVGIRKRRKWAHRLGIGVHTGAAIFLAIPLASIIAEDNFSRTSAPGSIRDTMTISLILGTWLLLIVLNVIPAIALLMRPGREWFGLSPRP